MAPQSALEVMTTLRMRLAEILYCEPEEISADTTFQELGLDSVLGAELVTTINREYALRETVETVYSHPTLAQLSAHVADRTSHGED